MIVRINQFDAPRPEAEAGWPSEGRLGPLLAPWPDGTRAYEVLILEQDEQRKALPESFRQQQLRQLIPQTVAALREPGEEVVVRLDGPLAEREALPAYRYLVDAHGHGRFAVSGATKIEPEPRDVMVAVRTQPAQSTLQAMCSDMLLGLERSVRLRALCVPAELVSVVIDIDSNDDERWPEVLRRAGFVLSTVRGMLALHVLTARYDAATVKGRLMQRLAALAQQGTPGQQSRRASSSPTPV
jgi:hypothetical protein